MELLKDLRFHSDIIRTDQEGEKLQELGQCGTIVNRGIINRRPTNSTQSVSQMEGGGLPVEVRCRGTAVLWPKHSAGRMSNERRRRTICSSSEAAE